MKLPVYKCWGGREGGIVILVLRCGVGRGGF